MQSEIRSNEIVPAVVPTVVPTVVASAQIAPRDLPPPQTTALEALLAGSSVTDAAAATGVDRSRLHNWLRKNLAFQAALNAGRKDLRQVIAHRLERLANDATECVGKAVREGDVKAALEIVKRLERLAPAISAAMTRPSWRSMKPSGNNKLAERGDRAENSAERRRDTRTLRRLLTHQPKVVGEAQKV